jgi:hypothetical protein
MMRRSDTNDSWKAGVGRAAVEEKQKDRRCAGTDVPTGGKQARQRRGIADETRPRREGGAEINRPCSAYPDECQTTRGTRAPHRRPRHARTPMLHCATARLFRVARLALFVEKSANVLRQFRTQKFDASGLRIRTKNFIRGRNLRRFGIHGLSPLQTDYLPRSPFRTSI